jgi:hypothetical protein
MPESLPLPSIPYIHLRVEARELASCGGDMGQFAPCKSNVLLDKPIVLG